MSITVPSFQSYIYPVRNITVRVSPFFPYTNKQRGKQVRNTVHCLFSQPQARGNRPCNNVVSINNGFYFKNKLVEKWE